jgi:hypothetical protein
MTNSAIETVALHTIILIRLAVPADVSIHTDALVAALRVLAGAVVLAGVLLAALVHILGAVLAAPVGRAAAGVGVDTVHTGGAVLAQVTRAVVNVLLAVVAGKAYKKKQDVSLLQETNSINKPEHLLRVP